MLSFTPEAKRIRDEMDALIVAKGRADAKLEPFLARTVENAIRLATIRAIGCDTMVVDEADMIWGRDIMLWSSFWLAKEAGLYISDSENQTIANTIKRALSGKGKISRSMLLQTLDHKFRARDLDGAMGLPIQSGKVEWEEVPQPSGAGRPGVFYTFKG